MNNEKVSNVWKRRGLLRFKWKDFANQGREWRDYRIETIWEEIS